MKQTLFLFAITTCFNFIGSAQIKKGAILFGGQISYSDNNSKYPTTQANQKNQSAVFNITAGTAVSENKVFGIAATYSHFNNDDFNNGVLYDNVKVSGYHIDIFYRLYKKLAKDFYLFGEVGTGYFTNNQTQTNLPNNSSVTEYKTSGAELYITPGIAYRIYKKLQVELVTLRIGEAIYGVQKRKSQPVNADDYKENAFGFNTSFNGSPLSSMGIGFKLVL